MTANFPRALRLAKSFESKKGIPVGIPFLVIINGERPGALDVEALVGAAVLVDVVEPQGAGAPVGEAELLGVCVAAYDEVLDA